jgi:hypothetical protein
MCIVVCTVDREFSRFSEITGASRQRAVITDVIFFLKEGFIYIL